MIEYAEFLLSIKILFSKNEPYKKLSKYKHF